MKKYFIVPMYAWSEKNSKIIQERVLVKANTVNIENYDEGKTLSVLKEIEVISEPKKFKIRNDQYWLEDSPFLDKNDFRFLQEKLKTLELKGVEDDDAARLIFECS